MTTPSADQNDLPNLASSNLGAKIIFATDEWFSEAPNLLKDGKAVFDETTFTEYGKEMDGWECRRRRKEGNDWAIIRLGLPGIVDTIEVDTLWFTGNYSPKCRIQAIYYDPENEPKECDILIEERERAVQARATEKLRSDGRMGLAASDREVELANALNSDAWEDVVPLQELGAGYPETCQKFFTLSTPKLISHLRLNMGPDGGIARLRVYGVVSKSQSSQNMAVQDLAYVENGGIALGCSDMHYGHPRNLTNPGRGLVMGDGWETARQAKRPAVYERGSDGLMVLPGNDWAVLQLGMPGTITSVDVDTNHYKGNYPESCLIEGCYVKDAGNTSDDRTRMKGLLCKDTNDTSVEWFTLLPRSPLTASEQHKFNLSNDVSTRPVSHLKLTIYPDGGVQRLRVYGTPLLDPKSRL